MTLIQNWLNGNRSFTYGVILYNRFGTDEELKKLFSLGKTDNTEAKLYTALKALSTPAESCHAEPVEALRGSAQMPDNNDKVLMQLKQKWMPLYTEMNYKRHELDKYLFLQSKTAQKNRAELARDILQLEKRCMIIWGDRDHYIKFKKLPPADDQQPVVVDPLKKVQRYKNVQGYIRRYNFLLRKDPTNIRNKELLQQFEAEFKQLEKEIK